MQAKDIPAPGSWGTKKARADEEAVLFRVEKVDPVKEQFTVERFAGHVGGVPMFGRQSTISFATWQTNRYHPCDPPAAPVPEMLDREQTEKRLLDEGADQEWIADIMRDPRVVLSWVADTAPRRVLRAHVRWLDAQAAPPVAVFVPPEPTLADVLASNEALRGEVAGLRADFRALMKAIEAAGGQLPLFRVAA
jgi:hypothetical protein